MIQHTKISIRQFTILVIIFVIGSSILVAPSGLAHEARQDAWIAAAIGVGISLLFVWLYIALANRFPQMTLTEYCEVVLGKWIGKTVSLMFSAYFFIVAALLLREISDFVTTQIMPETPIEIIILLYLVIVIMATRLGLETFTRATEIFFPWIIMLFLFLVVCLLPQMDIKKIQPVGEGVKPILRAVFPFLGLPFLELVVFLMIFPYVNRMKGAGKALVTGTLIGGAVLVIITALSISVIGPDFTARNTYPSYVLAKKISIGNFLERLEAIMAGIWFLSLYFKLTICFYASAIGLAQACKLKEYRPLLLPLGMIILPFSIFSVPNIIYFKDLLSKAWTPFSLVFGLFLPLLLLVVSVIRNKPRGGNG